MNDITPPLDGKDVIAAYSRAFGDYDRDLLKSASLMGAGGQLLQEMQQAVDSKVPMNFDDFDKRLHESLAANSKTPDDNTPSLCITQMLRVWDKEDAQANSQPLPPPPSGRMT